MTIKRILITTILIAIALFVFPFAIRTILNTTYAEDPPQDGELDSTFVNSIPAGSNQAIITIDLQSNGSMFVGGHFTKYNETSSNYIAKLDQSGNRDTSFDIGIGANSSVSAIDTQNDGKVIAGGWFTSFNGTTRNRLVRLNTDGSVDETFSIGTGLNNYADDIAIQSDGQILVAGKFSQYNGNTTNRIVRLNTNGSIDTSFNIGTGFDNEVYSLEIQSNGKILVSGEFNNFNGVSRPKIARLNNDGTLDTTFNPGIGANSYISDMKIQDNGYIVIVGNFTSYNGTSLNRIARLTPTGTIDSSFDIGTGADAPLKEIGIQEDGKIVVTGDFVEYNGESVNFLIRLNSDGSRDWTYYSSVFDSSTLAIDIQDDGKAIIGGSFSTLGYLARLNDSGSLDTSFNQGTGFNNTIRATAFQSDGKILVGGDFTKYNSNIASRIARLNNDGTFDSTFEMGTGFGAQVYAIKVLSDDKILVGGYFSSYNGNNSRSLIRLNSDGTFDSSFVVGTGANQISEIEIQSDNKILISGIFTTYNGITRNYIARINTDGSLDTTFDPQTGPNSFVYDIKPIENGKIMISGTFTSYNGVSRNSIARLNSDGTLDTTFNPGSGSNNYIRGMQILEDGKIIIIGDFTSYNGISANRIARLNPDGTLDTTFTPGTGANTSIYAVKKQKDGKLLIGGQFTSYNGTSVSRIARLNNNGTLDTTFEIGTGLDNIVNGIDLQDNGFALLYGIFNKYSGTVVSRLTRISIYDLVPPTGSLIISEGNQYISSIYTTISTTATDSFTGVTSMMI